MKKLSSDMKIHHIIFPLLVSSVVVAAGASDDKKDRPNHRRAITNGELDGENHPHVGLMVALLEDGTPLWRCSGVLLSPTVFLTAGHCVENPAARATVWFDADVESGIPGNGYPFEGDVSGSLAIHPEYYDAPFFVHDVGVVCLDEPYEVGEYGTLPEANELDQLATNRGQQSTDFTAVGYGLQYINPTFVEAERIRMYSEPHLIQINGGQVGDFSLLLSNNHATGGTCFGDSGGPNFRGDSNVVAGVTSFGLNGNCAGTGGVFRLDKEDVLDFVNGACGA